jgi:hypothetical protein
MMKQLDASEEMELFYQDVAASAKKHFGSADSLVVLAVLSNMVGKTLALMDQTRYTPQQYLNMIEQNIMLGNQQVISDLMNTQGEA